MNASTIVLIFLGLFVVLMAFKDGKVVIPLHNGCIQIVAKWLLFFGLVATFVVVLVVIGGIK
jgi:hypothetical protein